MSMSIPSMNAQQQREFDAPLIALAQKSGGDLRILLYSFFSFLHRKTDFYMIPNDQDVADKVQMKMGFKEGDAEKLLMFYFKYFPLRRMPRHSSAKVDRGDAKIQQSVVTNEKDNGKQVVTEPTANSDTTLKDKPEKGTSDTSDTQPNMGKKNNSEDDVRVRVRVKYTSEGKQCPVGNGGTSVKDKYSWTQTLGEVTIACPLPDESTRAKDLNVEIKSELLCIKTKNSKVKSTEDPSSCTLFSKSLHQRIQADESTWSIENGVLLIVLEKQKKMWWNALSNMDETDASDVIDISLIDSNRPASYYEDCTQAMIQKVLLLRRRTQT